MALIKSLINDSGVPLSYHRIINYTINYDTQTITFTVASYVNKEARISGYKPVEKVDVVIDPVDLALINVPDALNVMYSWFKANAIGFEDAVDDVDG